MVHERCGIRQLAAAVMLTAASHAAPAAAAQARTIAGVAWKPRRRPTAERSVAGGLFANQGNATSRRADARSFSTTRAISKPGEPVVFILSLHGAGSIGNWQRHYFPAMDYKDKYRLVIATPTAATTASITFRRAGGPHVDGGGRR